MFCLHVQYNTVLRHVIDQCAVGFIAFCHQVVAVCVPVCIGPQHRDFGAHVVAGAQSCFAQQVCCQGRGCGFAVSAGNYHALLVVQNGSQTLCAAHAQTAQFAGCSQGHVIFANGAGINDNFCICNGFCCVRACKRQAALLQALGFFAGDAVAAAHSVPHFQEHACNAAHAGTGHADKMDTHRVFPVQKSFAQLVNHSSRFIIYETAPQASKYPIAKPKM